MVAKFKRRLFYVFVLTPTRTLWREGKFHSLKQLCKWSKKNPETYEVPVWLFIFLHILSVSSGWLLFKGRKLHQHVHANATVAQKGHTCKLKMSLQIKNRTCKLKILPTWNINGPTALRPGGTARTRSSSLILRAQEFLFLICIDMFSIFNLQHNF